MADLPSRLDLYALGRDYVLARAKKIDPKQVDVEGSNANIFVGSTSIVGDHILKQLAFRTAALTLEGAEDEDLDRYAFDRYQLSRKGASPARGEVKIVRFSFAGGAGTVPIGTKVMTNTGVEYVTTSVASFGATDLESRANVRAAEAGKATQVDALAIERFSNPGALFDKTLEVTNPKATAGGEETETDDLFRNRIRGFWRAARRGILAAIEQGALSVPGVVSARATEILTTGSTPARLVQLFIADSTGVASEALATEVRTALDEYRAGGIQVLISTSMPLIVSVKIRLRFRANVDTVTLSDNVRNAVVSFVNSLPVNGTLYAGELFALVSRFRDDGVIVSDDAIVLPVGDLVPAVGQTIRTTLANVTTVFS